MMKLRRLATSAGAAVAVAAGGGFALLPASPALAFFSGGLFLDVIPQSPATLVAKGAAVDVPVQVTCNATGPASVHVDVSERVNGQIASGGGNVQVGCTGGHTTILVRVTAQSGPAFAKGKAVANAVVFGCNSVLCAEETNSATITLKK
jgi:hypothetical protein